MERKGACSEKSSTACSLVLSTYAGRASAPAALRLGFTLTASLRGLVVSTTTSLGQDTILLNFAVETFESYLKRITWVHFDLAHRDYQRDRRPLLRPEFDDCDWKQSLQYTGRSSRGWKGTCASLPQLAQIAVYIWRGARSL